MTVYKTRLRIEARINKAKLELSNLRDHVCTHDNVIVTYKSDTGNYDPAEDGYWTTHQCPDCGKYWTTDITNRKLQ